jgi:hypothetical protein
MVGKKRRLDSTGSLPRDPDRQAPLVCWVPCGPHRPAVRTARYFACLAISSLSHATAASPFMRPPASEASVILILNIQPAP